MQKVRDSRPWYRCGKVICIAEYDSQGYGYRHPVRPYRPGNSWDESVIRGLMRQGYVVVIVDYGWQFEIPSFYNNIPSSGEQLNLFDYA